MRRTAKLKARFSAQSIAHTGSLDRLPVALIALFAALLVMLPADARASRSRSTKHSASARHAVHTKGRHSARAHSTARTRHVSKRSGGHAHASRHSAHARHVESGIAPADPVWESEPRRRNYALINQAYQLYDRALSEKLRGNYGLALDKLGEAVNVLDQARSHQRGNVPSTMEAHVFYELGQIAELDNDTQLARDSYVHCFRAQPNFVEAYVRLATLLAGKGDIAQALNYARDGARLCPGDIRLDTTVRLLESKAGASPQAEPVSTEPAASIEP